MLTATKGGITLSSTTASQEVLDKAVGVTAADKPLAQPDANPSVTTGEESESAETVPNSEAGNQPESEEQKQAKQGGWQRTIKKKDREIGTLTETLKEERLARQRLEAQLAGKPAVTEAKPANAAGADDVEPDENKVNPKTGKPWESWKEFNAEHTRWVLRQEKLAETAKASQTADNAELQKAFQSHAERLNAAKAKYSDWDQVSESLNKEATVPEGVAMTLVELENGPDVIYHLAKNPEVLKELRGMSELRAITKIGVIADKLATEAKTASDKAAADKADADAAATDKSGKKPDGSPANKTVTSGAPDPINPVGSGSSHSTVDRSKLDTTAYIKGRNNGTIK